jgi:hypothetical protein
MLKELVKAYLACPCGVFLTGEVRAMDNGVVIAIAIGVLLFSIVGFAVDHSGQYHIAAAASGLMCGWIRLRGTSKSTRYVMQAEGRTN